MFIGSNQNEDYSSTTICHALFLLLQAFLPISTPLFAQHPNIIIIYADDMGYDDLFCQNPNSKIATPNIVQLANNGIRFTHTHSSSGVYSPSRLRF